MKTKTPYLFFKSFAGFSYDPKTETAEDGKRRCARELALAERKARDAGLSFVWQADDITSEEFSDEKPFRQLFICLLIDRTGKTLASCGGIDLANGDSFSDPYCRVMEAELASEHFGRENN